jgi:2-dehydropantoate 2-reductase
MKDMMDYDFTEMLAQEILREGIEVARAVGISLNDGFFEHAVEYLRGAGYHLTSMHQDVVRRVPIEIDWISGKIVEWGRIHGIKTPYNLTLAALLKGFELESKAPPEQLELHP